MYLDIYRNLKDGTRKNYTSLGSNWQLLEWISWVLHHLLQVALLNICWKIKGKAPTSFARYLLEHQQRFQLSDDELAYLAGSMFGAGADTVSRQIYVQFYSVDHFAFLNRLRVRLA